MQQRTIHFGEDEQSYIQTHSGFKPPVTLIRDYLNPAQQGALKTEAATFAFKQPQIKIRGELRTIACRQVWFGDEGCDYEYSSLLINAQPWPKYANKLKQKLRNDFGLYFNGVLVNQYLNGRQHVGWHDDDEPELIRSATIASISVGASRDFSLRHNNSREVVTIPLHSGDLLLMHSPMQQQWQHCLPKRLKVEESRLNFTFRQLTPFFHLK
ncbi:alpha-ketoglutarate-dependent dioxygenase AlkB [Psychrobium sp. 1_MG-2023]|uniref:alpha-ketoglutarate-dependent dioxygenase AlkB family protein n=1 Tax=Psychrobium sp. 1_MG-2023 TaxID=3062624 RepID=UPI000C31C0E0|nr:alpha-ketoglutarate-dependent dioxygenase AlkB [Psychrobium sp. 1_MG-2023]MDP2562711.1 alpha-ketoglutarate-dependent dioxygenase AlkB [Psychrobium sp. 1_MG-2023]PKF54025.1 2OG-Fe(II) oxygenase [Alteromonadales bacterium alter-6D02]